MELKEFLEQTYPVSHFEFSEKEQFAMQKLEEYLQSSKFIEHNEAYIRAYIATTLEALNKLASEYANLLEIEEEHRKENGKLREEVKMHKESI